MNFDHEELMLMMLYNTGTRLGLIHELRLMQCYLMPDETALRELNRRGKTPDPEHYEVTYYADLPAMWQDVPSDEVLEELFQMLYIFGCGIYTAYRQTWNQFLILLVAEFLCFVLFFGATAITEGIGRFSEWLAEL